MSWLAFLATAQPRSAHVKFLRQFHHGIPLALPGIPSRGRGCEGCRRESGRLERTCSRSCGDERTQSSHATRNFRLLHPQHADLANRLHVAPGERAMEFGGECEWRGHIGRPTPLGYG